MSDTSSTEGTRVILDYTSRDFAAIRTQLVGLAKGFMPEWETVGETGDFGTLVLELFAYMGDVLNFYIDRAASEAFLGTALRRQSVLYIADMMGYKPVGQHSASVKLLFGMVSETEGASVLTLPAGTRIYNETDNSADVIVFELDNPLTLSPGQTDVVAYATEGAMVYDNLLGISLGGPALELVIPEKGVVTHSITIKSREGGQIVDWTEVTDISLGRPTQSVFTTYLDDYDNTHILFGDNAAGRIPPVNAEIFGSYRLGVGVEANQLAPDTLKIIASTAELSDQLWSVSVRNPESPVGGTDPESTDSMRFSIPRAAGRIKNRAITLNDYADLALQVPGVAKSTAYGTLYTAIHVRIAPTGGQGDAVTMKRLCDEVEAYLADKILVGSAVSAEPEDIHAPQPIGLWQPVHLRVVVHVQPAYNRTTVRSEVDRVLRDVLAFDSVDFGTRVSIGLIYRTALAVNGVEWVDLNWLSTVAPTHAQEIGMDTDDAYQSVNEIITDSVYIPRIHPLPAVKTASVTNVALTSNVATLTTGSAHGMTTGQTIDVTGVTPSLFNGQYKITTAGATTLSYAKTNANVASTPLVTPGKVTTVNLPELETDFPDLTEEERAHDGLWVKAVGGLVAT